MDRTANSYAYAPVITPGYNADKVYSFFTDQAVAIAAPQIRETMDAVENNKPVAEKKLKRLIPSHKHLDELAAKALEDVQVDAANYAIPAAAVGPADSREVIVNEENSVSGKKITKAYKMVLINGQWITRPMWEFTESKLQKDSIQIVKDSIIKPFQIIQ